MSAPTCAACGLTRGAGWLLDGAGLVEVDPCPEDPGIWIGQRWVCSVECGTFAGIGLDVLDGYREGLDVARVEGLRRPAPSWAACVEAESRALAAAGVDDV